MTLIIKMLMKQGLLAYNQNHLWIPKNYILKFLCALFGKGYKGFIILMAFDYDCHCHHDHHHHQSYDPLFLRLAKVKYRMDDHETRKWRFLTI